MVKAILLSLCFILSGSKPQSAKKELSLEELRTAEMMEILEMMDELMDENFTVVLTAEVEQGIEEKKEEEKNESGK